MFQSKPKLEKEIREFHCECMQKFFESEYTEIKNLIDKLSEKQNEIPLSQEIRARNLIRGKMESFYSPFVNPRSYCLILMGDGFSRCKNCKYFHQKKYLELVEYYDKKLLRKPGEEI